MHRRIKFVWPICERLRFDFVELKWRELISVVNLPALRWPSVFAFVRSFPLGASLWAAVLFLFAPTIEPNEWTLLWTISNRRAHTKAFFFSPPRKQFTLSSRLFFFVFGPDDGTNKWKKMI